MSNTIIRPFVSIIIPAYNCDDSIRSLLDSLIEQTYPKDRYEIIVVDNGSTDDTSLVVSSYSDVQLLYQKDIQSSYAARNKAVHASKGNILLFIDSDCKADFVWIDAMVTAFEEPCVMIAAGQVYFYFSTECTAAEQWDSLIHMHNKSCVQKGNAKTANLGIRKEVFDRIGMFPVVKSGGDISWTSKASQSGEMLVYVDNAIVYHPARTFRELMKKFIRVGGGSIAAWRDSGRSWIWIIAAVCSLPLPLVVNDVYKYIKVRGQKDMQYMPIRMMMVAYMGRLFAFLGIIYSLFVKCKKHLI